ncbi:MAG TPA: T9SS type A sorting domain-containing protein [Bacteroidales bacterium]|nr:T9SS type A sorting domain-containing protein [Bacteroidales bacterium]
MTAKKTLLPVFLLFVMATALSLWYVQGNNNQRQRYEEWLHQAMQIIPGPDVQLKDIPKADRPDVAAIQNYFQTLDPALGYVPLKRQYQAFQQTKQLSAAGQRNPALSWSGTRTDMGGRTRAIMYDPNDLQHKAAFAAGVTGGLWYNFDIANPASDWEPIGDLMPNMAISALTYDPNDPMTMYAGTGEAQTARVIYRQSSGLGMGVMKSTDGGFSWELLPSTADFAYVTDVKVRNENGQSVVYAAVVSGEYEGAVHQSQPSDGVYRSADGGNTWQQVLPEIPGQAGKPYAPAQIEIAANNRIFVGTMENTNLKGGAVVLWSDAGTAGSWTAYTNYNSLIQAQSYYNIPARTLVSASPSNPNIVYAQFAAGYNDGFYYYRGRYMAKSVDGGQTWSPVNIPSNSWSTLAWHAFVLKVDPVNPNHLFTGGLDLWKSTNGGQSWNQISDWSLMYYGGGDEYVHADQHNIQFNPANPQQALFSSDGGVFMSQNAHMTIPIFTEKNQAFNTLQFYSCAISPDITSDNNKSNHPNSSNDQFLGGLQDNGSLKYTANTLTINDMISGGDGAYCFWDQNEPNLYITSVYYNSYYIFKNNSNFDNVNADNGTFVSPADYDYRTNTLYANAVGFAGENAGQLIRISGIGSESGLSQINLGTANNVPFSYVGFSKFSPPGTTTLIVGTQSGRLYKVLNAQAEQPQVTDIGSSSFPTANISSVAIGGSEDTLLVTFSNYGVSSVWQSFNGGANWHEREGNLPDMPIRWAIYHPQNTGQAMLATETGIWTSNTLLEPNTVWVPASEGMSPVRVDMLRLRENDLKVIAASHGRGMFTTNWNVDIYTSQSEKTTANDWSVYPNPATDFLSLSFGTDKLKTLSYSIYTADGKQIQPPTILDPTSNNRLIAVDRLKKGTYILHVKSDLQNKAIRFLKQ